MDFILAIPASIADVEEDYQLVSSLESYNQHVYLVNNFNLIIPYRPKIFSLQYFFVSAWLEIYVLLILSELIMLILPLWPSF